MGKKILIIEDDPAFLDILNLYCDRQYSVLTCGSKTEAGRLLADFKPDAVILDLNPDPVNPGITEALELLQDIKKNNIKALVSTVENDPAVRAEVLEAGADDYLNKPYTCEMLEQSIEKSLNHINDEKTSESRRNA